MIYKSTKRIVVKILMKIINLKIVNIFVKGHRPTYFWVAASAWAGWLLIQEDSLLLIKAKLICQCQPSNAWYEGSGEIRNSHDDDGWHSAGYLSWINTQESCNWVRFTKLTRAQGGGRSEAEGGERTWWGSGAGEEGQTTELRLAAAQTEYLQYRPDLSSVQQGGRGRERESDRSHGNYQPFRETHSHYHRLGLVYHYRSTPYSLPISLYILLILGRIIVSSTLSYHQGIPDWRPVLSW